MNLGGAQLIRCLLFDVDDTLMDYHQAETQILRRIFAENGKVPSQAELDDLWEKILAVLEYAWFARKPGVRRFSEIMSGSIATQLTDCCAYMRRKYDLKQDENALYELFGRYLGEAVTLYDDVLPVLKMLKGYFVLCAASNALSDCQRPRLRAMGIRFDHIFLSEEMGTIKPAQAFFPKDGVGGRVRNGGVYDGRRFAQLRYCGRAKGGNENLLDQSRGESVIRRNTAGCRDSKPASAVENQKKSGRDFEMTVFESDGGEKLRFRR